MRTKWPDHLPTNIQVDIMDYKEVDNYKRKKLIFSDMGKLENKVQILYIHKQVGSEAPLKPAFAHIK